MGRSRWPRRTRTGGPRWWLRRCRRMPVVNQGRCTCEVVSGLCGDTCTVRPDSFFAFLALTGTACVPACPRCASCLQLRRCFFFTTFVYESVTFLCGCSFRCVSWIDAMCVSQGA